MWEKINKDDLINDIISGINNIPEINPGEQPNWTTEVKDCLAKIAIKYGLECSYTLKSDGKKEFLFDFIMHSFLEYSDNEFFPGGKSIGAVYLCAESEWDTNIDSIQDDFEKLLASNAPIRLMVYSVCEANKTKHTGWLKFIIKNNPMVTNETTFILAACVSPNDIFEIEKFVKE